MSKDIRDHIIFQNYDYTEEGANETSPGGGLYHGRMDKYKSVDDFLKKRKKEKSKKRIKALEEILNKISLGKNE